MKNSICRSLLMVGVWLAGTVLAADGVVRIKCIVNDEIYNEGVIYIDDKPKGECPVVTLFLPPDKYALKVKKDLSDDSYYVFETSRTVYDKSADSINAVLERKYTEDYYWNVAQKDKTPKAYEEYLEKYPTGKYAKQIQGILESAYWNSANSSKSWTILRHTLISTLVASTHKKLKSI